MARGLPGGARGDQAGLVGEDHEPRPVAGPAGLALLILVAITAIRVRRADLGGS